MEEQMDAFMGTLMAIHRRPRTRQKQIINMVYLLYSKREMRSMCLGTEYPKSPSILCHVLDSSPTSKDSTSRRGKAGNISHTPLRWRRTMTLARHLSSPTLNSALRQTTHRRSSCTGNSIETRPPHRRAFKMYGSVRHHPHVHLGWR